MVFASCCGLSNRRISLLDAPAPAAGRRSAPRLIPPATAATGTCPIISAQAGSPDRRFLYYAKDGSPTTVWRVALGGGDDVQLVDGVSYPNNSSWVTGGIYFLAVGDAVSKSSIDFYQFSTGRRTTLATVGKRPVSRCRQIRRGCCLPPSIGMAAT